MVKTAFLFPGQGSQYLGMGKKFYDNCLMAREIYEEACHVLRMDIASLCFKGPVEKLNLTENTQPAILIHSIIALKCLEDHGIETLLAAGHSLGEYSALVAAGSLQFADAVRIVQKRGQFMQEAVPVGIGAMAAILGLPLEEIQNLCNKISNERNLVQPANINSPGQIVIAGHKNAVELLSNLAKQAGAKRAIMLPVSAPFHCSLMKPAELKLQVELEKSEFNSLKFPVVTNVDALPVLDGHAARDALRRQVCLPVRWIEIMEYICNQGIKRIIEFGPKQILSQLMKRFDKTIECYQVEDPESLENTCNSIS